MEKRLNAKLEQYVSGFKREITDKLSGGADKDELISFVMNYKVISLDNKDFLKRKRSNNVVPVCEKCIAKRMNGTQCTRRKQGGTEFCGTHFKGTPHGIMEQSNTEKELKQIEVFQQEINGIIYYIDHDKNVYSVEDIQSNKINPKVIASYTLVDGVYVIV
jgi:hypothetical protein